MPTTAPGSRSSRPSGTPTCGRRRRAATTRSRRSRSPRRGRRACASAPRSFPAFTRGAATIAQTVAAMCQAAPGRFALGIGTSSDVIVEQWNGIPFEKPFHRVRDTIRFLRAGARRREGHRGVRDLRGARASASVWRSPRCRRSSSPRCARACCASPGREGDGAIINWLSADDVQTVVPARRRGQGDRRPHLRAADRPTAISSTSSGRRAIAAYLNVPVYAKFHEWLGRGEMLEPMWDAWRAGDRKAATEAIPDRAARRAHRARDAPTRSATTSPDSRPTA